MSDNEQNEIKGDIDSFRDLIQNYNKQYHSLTQMKSFKTFQDCLNSFSQQVSECEASTLHFEYIIQKNKDSLNTNNQNEKDKLYIKNIERLYGLEIVKLENNNIKFIFSGINEKRLTEKNWVIFSLKDSKWMFSESFPKIHILDELEILNKDHNLTVFLNSVRNKFKKSYK